VRFTQHPSNNRVLGAPAGWDQQALPCNALPVTFQSDETGPCFTSFWQPSDAEKKAIADGALVKLSIFNSTHPPVWIGVEGVPE
jgi:hypothetical protein